MYSACPRSWSSHDPGVPPEKCSHSVTISPPAEGRSAYVVVFLPQFSHPFVYNWLHSSCRRFLSGPFHSSFYRHIVAVIITGGHHCYALIVPRRRGGGGVGARSKLLFPCWRGWKWIVVRTNYALYRLPNVIMVFKLARFLLCRCSLIWKKNTSRLVQEGIKLFVYE